MLATAVDTPSPLLPKTPPVKAESKSSNPALSLNALPKNTTVAQLADAISRLNLIETTQLVTLLKKTLKLPDMLAAAPLPATTAAPAAAAVAPTPVAPPAKTEFTLTLEKFEPTSKAKVIKEIKAILTTLNLVEAKAFVEGAPKIVKEKLKKEEGEKLKKALEDAGATVTLD